MRKSNGQKPPPRKDRMRKSLKVTAGAFIGFAAVTGVLLADGEPTLAAVRQGDSSIHVTNSAAPPLGPDSVLVSWTVRKVAEGPILEVSTALGTPNDLGTGLGIAIAYDPAELEFAGATEVMREGLLAVSEKADSDSRDLDRDPATPVAVRAAWISVSGHWAGAQNGGTIGRFLFKPAKGIASFPPVPKLAVVQLRTGEGGTYPVYRLLKRSSAPRLRLGVANATGRRSRGDEADPAWEFVLQPPTSVSGRKSVQALGAMHALADELLPSNLDVDGNGARDALTDGLLILRYLFGFRGATLTRNALGAGATRTTPDAVVAFLSAADAQSLLDADANTAPDALTDGLLILRYLFGFRGAVLVSGAVAANATRVDPGEVAQFLQFCDNPRIVLAEGEVVPGQPVSDAWDDVSVEAVQGSATVRITEGTDDDNGRYLVISGDGEGTLNIQCPRAGTLPPTEPSSFPHVAAMSLAGGGWSAQATSKVFVKASSATMGPPPLFLRTWLPWGTNRLPEYFQSGFSVPVTQGGFKLELIDRIASQLVGDCDPSLCLTGRQAVLFVHGYSMGSDMGDAKGTFQQFGDLLGDTGLYRPYYFNWNTSARFQDVASDLAAAVNQLADASGRKVHVVAHSMGGLVTRALLQRLATSSDENVTNPPEASLARASIASVTTIGTPHSGILDNDVCSDENHGAPRIPIPGGQDSLLFEGCRQLSCYILGEWTSLGYIASIFDVKETGGEFVKLLVDRESDFPNVQLQALIGWDVNVSIFGDRFDVGDNLISFEGQRFTPLSSFASATCDGAPPPQSYQFRWDHHPFGTGFVTEKGLGLAASLPRPENALPSPCNLLVSWDPACGYLHSESLAVSRLRQRAEPAVRTDKPGCVDKDNCDHDSYVQTRAWLGEYPGATITPSSPIEITVTVRDASTTQPIDGARVRLSGGYGVFETTADQGGYASVTVPFVPKGVYSLQIMSSGYRVLLQDIQLPLVNTAASPLGTKLLELDTVQPPGKGSLLGKITDALTASPIARAAYTLRRTDHSQLDRTGSSDTGGHYAEQNLVPGIYELVLSAGGYQAATRTFTVLSNSSTDGNVSLNPILSGNQMRTVLTWGANPRDLDSHTLKYKPLNHLEYHIYYDARSGTGGDFLDVDDTSGYGPETTTIQSVDPAARYVFYVYHYAGSGSITSTSNAVVTVYQGDQPSVVINAPNSGEGSYWKVYEVNNGVLTICSSNCISNVAASSLTSLQEKPK